MPAPAAVDGRPAPTGPRGDRSRWRCADARGSMVVRVRPERCFPYSGRCVTPGFLSQVEAARMVGCSRDTIVRARRSGRFPNARLEAGHWIIPTGDLMAANLYKAPEPGGNAPEDSPDVPAGTEPVVIGLARAQARIAGLEALVASQDDELRFLRLTVETLARRGAA